MTKASTASAPRAAGRSLPRAAATAALVGRWRELLDTHATVSCALEKELQSRHHIGLSEFETLDRLVDAACETYRMSDLAADVYLSQSALSRAVARLERDGLVSRSMCSDDRRAIFVCLTDHGRALHAEAAPTHREILQQLLPLRLPATRGQTQVPPE